MIRRTIGIIDYGAGNLSSVQRAFLTLGHRCWISGDVSALDAADLLVLPGVGAFPHAMANLVGSGLDRYVKASVRQGRPLLGICLGMQLLVDRSSENGLTAGLGLIPGEVLALQHGHIGWNSLETISEDPMLAPSDGQSFYFNHNFQVTVPEDYCVAIARHHGKVVAAIRRGRVAGLQFHPEKSQSAGRALLAGMIEGLCA